MASNINWTQVAVGVGGVLIAALQGTNIVQGVAIQGTEARIERVEEDLAKANNELNRMILNNQEAFKKKTEDFDHTLLANQNEFRNNVKEFKQYFQTIIDNQKK